METSQLPKSESRHLRPKDERKESAIPGTMATKPGQSGVELEGV